jgi:hypothetical protein
VREIVADEQRASGLLHALGADGLWSLCGKMSVAARTFEISDRRHAVLCAPVQEYVNRSLQFEEDTMDASGCAEQDVTNERCPGAFGLLDCA